MEQRIKLDLNNQEIIYSKLLDMKDNSAKTKVMIQDVTRQCNEVFVEGYTQFHGNLTFAQMERKYNDLDVVVGVTLFYVLKAFKTMIRQDRILAARVLNGMLNDKNVKEEDKKYIIDNQEKMLDKTEKTLKSRREAAERGEVPPPEQNDAPAPVQQPRNEPSPLGEKESSKNENMKETRQIDGQFKKVKEGLYYNEETHQYGILQQDGQCLIIDESEMPKEMMMGQTSLEESGQVGSEGFQQVSEGVYYNDQTGHYALQQENGEFVFVDENGIAQDDASESNSRTILETKIAEEHMHQATWNYQTALHPDVQSSIENLPPDFIEKSHTILSQVGGQEPTIHNTVFSSAVEKPVLRQAHGLEEFGNSVFRPETGARLKSKTLVNTMKVGTFAFSNGVNEKKGF